MDSRMIVAYAHRVTRATKWGIGITLAVAMALSCAVGAAVYLIVQETGQQALLREG